MHVLRSLVPALALLLAPFAAPAQVNVERDRTRPDQPGFFLDLDLRIGFKEGNVNLLDVGGRTLVGYASGADLVYLVADSRFAAQTTARDDGTLGDTLDRDARFTNRHLAHLRYNRTLNEWLIGEAFTQIETDEFVLVNERVLVGVGPRFILWSSPDLAAFLGTAYMIEYEALDPTRFISQPTSDAPDNTWHRWSNYASVRVALNDRANLVNTAYIQPRFDAFGDVRLLDELQLQVKITKSVSLKIIGSISYDSRPPTYCESRLEGAPCPLGDVVTLQRRNISFDNAFALELRN